MAKKTRFAFRTTDEFKQRIAHVAEILGLDQAVVGEAALEAVVAYVEKYGELTIPVRLEGHIDKEADRSRPPVPRSFFSAHKPVVPPLAKKKG